MEMQALRRKVVKYSHRIWDQGWVANHDGNITVRMDKSRVLATPSAFSNAEVKEEDLLVIEIWTGKVVSGRHRAFSELGLHLEYYKCREDVNAVLHAHPPVSCALSIAGIEVEPRMSAEAVISLGDRIPLAPYAFPASLESRRQIRFLGQAYDVIMMANHGVIACGTDLEQAYLRVELCEQLAKMQQGAIGLGNLRLIPEAWVSDLLAKRKKAGLGPESRGEKIPSPRDLSSLPADELVEALVEKLKE